MTKIKALLSTNKIRDSIFKKSIVLMIKEHNDSYTGLILNQTMKESVKSIWEYVNPDFHPYKNNPIRVGGPLYGSVIVLHKIKKYAEDEILPKVYMSIHPENIEPVLKNKRTPYEMYIGYSAWAPIQLKIEIEKGNWWIIEPDENMIFGDNSELWENLKKQRDEILAHNLGIKKQNYALN